MPSQHYNRSYSGHYAGYVYSFASAEAILATFNFYDSKRSIGFVRFSAFIFFVLSTARSIFVHASEVPAEAFCSCPGNKAKRQFRAFETESNQHWKGIEEEEIKYS